MGRFTTVDFFMKGPPGAMIVTETSVHKINGQPYYAWEQKRNGTWRKCLKCNEMADRRMRMVRSQQAKRDSAASEGNQPLLMGERAEQEDGMLVHTEMRPKRLSCGLRANPDIGFFECAFPTRDSAVGLLDQSLTGRLNRSASCCHWASVGVWLPCSQSSTSDVETPIFSATSLRRIRFSNRLA